MMIDFSFRFQNFLFYFLFSIFESSKESFAKHGKYTDLQTSFSEKNIWFSSQVFWEISVPKLQGNKS